MNRDELHAHPAFRALSAEEQAAVDERLGNWQLDALALAATTGDADQLDAGDLRFWLASTAQRPWAMLQLQVDPKLADAIFRALIDLAEDEGFERRPERAAHVSAARSLGRSLALTESAREELGFVREEQLGALWRQIDGLEQLEDEAWEDDDILEALEGLGLDELRRELRSFRRETTGLRKLFKQAGERLETALYDAVHGGLFVITGSPKHEGRYRRGRWTNWTSSYEVEPRHYCVPRSEQELCEAVAKASKLRVVGAGHSFNDSPMSGDTMLSLDAYDQILAVDLATKRIRAQAGIRLRELNKALQRLELGLPVLGSHDAQAIGGLIATDLHGTGRDFAYLSQQILSLKVVAADGSVQTVREGDPLFHAAIGGIGACGVVCEVELQLVDKFNLEKQAKMVDQVELEQRIDQVIADNDHCSYYLVGGADRPDAVRLHRWNHTSAPLSEDWERLKTRKELTDFAISAYAHGVAETLAETDEDSWLSDLLSPDSRLVMPCSRGFGRTLYYRHDEMEFAVAHEDYKACLHEVLDMLARRDLFTILEMRFSPDASKSLIGPGAGRRSAWVELATPFSSEQAEAFAEAEAILLEHGGRPHLGKKTTMTAHDMLQVHGERFVQFQAVRRRQDPQGKFLNPFTEQVFGPVA